MMSATPPAAAAASCVDNSCSNNYMVPKVAMAVGTAHIPIMPTSRHWRQRRRRQVRRWPHPVIFSQERHRVSISCMARALFSFSLHAGACCTDHQALPPAAERDNRVEGSAKRRAVGAAPTHLAMVTVVEVSVGVDAMVAN